MIFPLFFKYALTFEFQAFNEKIELPLINSKLYFKVHYKEKTEMRKYKKSNTHLQKSVVLFKKEMTPILSLSYVKADTSKVETCQDFHA